MKLSFWEYETLFSDAEVCIIGAGIIGLVTAIELKEIDPKLKIVVVDQQQIGSAATTRNAGFACFGSVSELVSDMDAYGEDRVRELVGLRWNGLKRLVDRFGGDRIDYHQWGGSEVFENRSSFEKYADSIDVVNSLVEDIIGDDETFVVKEIDHRLNFYKDTIYNPLEGQLHSGKLYSEMVRSCHNLGIRIMRGVKVKNYQSSGNKVSIETKDFMFKVNALALCTNAFSKYLNEDINVEPGRNQVLITEPIAGSIPHGTYHFDHGYVYFRNVGNRILIGGGRNKYPNEATGEFGYNEENIKFLLNLLHDKVNTDEKIEVDRSWSGILSGGPSKIPIVKKVEGNVFAAVRMGGMGVAIGSEMAKKLSQLIINDR